MNVIKEADALKAQLDAMRREHRLLDERIEGMARDVSTDQITLRRLKKRKLQLKDQMSRLEDALYPDIIA